MWVVVRKVLFDVSLRCTDVTLHNIYKEAATEYKSKEE